MNFKESDFRKKLKRIKAEQIVSIVAVLIVLTLAVVLTVTAVNNRAKKNELPDLGDKQNSDQKTPVEDTSKGNDKKPDTSSDKTAEPTVKDETPPTLSLPVAGNLSQGHSVEVQVFSKTLNEYRTHLGIDISTAENAEVRAAADGSVAKVWEDPLMGYCVALTHAGECVSVYKNLAMTLAKGIEEGATVKAGQLIGNVGDSAMTELAEEPHLHMEVTVKGLQVDPMDYFSRSVAETLMGDETYEDNGAQTTTQDPVTTTAK